MPTLTLSLAGKHGHPSREPSSPPLPTPSPAAPQALAGLTFPTDGVRGRRPFDAGELVGAVCPMPGLKLLHLSTIGNKGWSGRNVDTVRNNSLQT